MGELQCEPSWSKVKFSLTVTCSSDAIINFPLWWSNSSVSKHNKSYGLETTISNSKYGVILKNLACVSGTDRISSHYYPPYSSLYFYFLLIVGENLSTQITSSNILFKCYWKACKYREKLKPSPHVQKLLFFLNWEIDKEKNWKITYNHGPAYLPFTSCNQLLGKVIYF